MEFVYTKLKIVQDIPLTFQSPLDLWGLFFFSLLLSICCRGSSGLETGIVGIVGVDLQWNWASALELHHHLGLAWMWQGRRLNFVSPLPTRTTSLFQMSLRLNCVWVVAGKECVGLMEGVRQSWVGHYLGDKGIGAGEI